MTVRQSTMNDFEGWLELAREVEPLFGPMADEPAFCEGLKQAILEGKALCIDGDERGRISGGVIISSEANEILWLAVAGRLRGQKAGAALLTEVLMHLDSTRPVAVTTFDKTVKAGIPARRLYESFGFKDQLSAGVNPAGIPISVMLLERISSVSADVMNGNMKFTLRTALNEDRDKIERLVFGILKEYGLKPDPESTDSDLSDIRREYLDRGGAFDVMTDENGRIVATVGLYRLDSSTCEIRKMYLDADLRGKGLGRRLLEYALSRARSLGYSRVELETASVLKEAIKLYESYGFHRHCRDHLASRCDAAYFLELAGHDIQSKEY